MNETTKHYYLGTENFVWYFFSPRLQLEYATVCFLTTVDRRVGVYLFIFSLLFVKKPVPFRLTPDKLTNQIRI